MVGRTSSDNSYLIIAQREILEKLLFELSHIDLSGRPLYQIFNQPLIEKLISRLAEHKHQLKYTALLQSLCSDENYLKELYIGSIYSLAYALSTSPASFEGNQDGKKSLLEAGSTDVDDEPTRRATEDAFESSSCLTKFEFQDLDSWKSLFGAFTEAAYQEFIYSFYRSKSGLDLKKVYSEVLVDVVRDFYFVEREKIENSKALLEKEIKEKYAKLLPPATLTEFRKQLTEILDDLKSEFKKIGVDSRPFHTRLESLHYNYPFLINCPTLPSLSHADFQAALRSFLNSDSSVPSIFEKFSGGFKKKEFTFEVRCPIVANFYESKDQKFAIPDLSSIRGMKIQERTPRFSSNSPAYELFLPKITGRSVGQILSQSKALFSYAVDLVRLSESTPPKIEMTGEVSYHDHSTKRSASAFKAIHKPWLSDYDKGVTKFVGAYSKFIDDDRPVAERFRRAIKLYSASKTTDDPFMRFTLMWAMFVSILDSEDNIIKHLPFMHFCNSSGGRFNDIRPKVEKQEMFKSEVLRFRSELTQIKESKEVMIGSNYSHIKISMDLQAAADAIEKYRESAMRFVKYALMADDPICKDVFDYIRSIGDKLAN